MISNSGQWAEFPAVLCFVLVLNLSTVFPGSNAQMNFLSQFFSTSSQPMNDIFQVKSALTRRINNPATFQITVF